MYHIPLLETNIFPASQKMSRFKRKSKTHLQESAVGSYPEPDI
jgi:hypothetical protein